MPEGKSSGFALKSIGDRIRPILILGVGVLVFLQVLVFSPGSLETEGGLNLRPVLEPTDLIKAISNDGDSLAPGIPKDRVPEYAVDGFNYLSTQAGKKQWKLIAQKAYLYNKEKIVHGRTVIAHLFDNPEAVTVITGNESKYLMNDRDLEVFGNVKTVFPDGFVFYSDYLRYKPNERKIEIPVTHKVRGEGEMETGKKIDFKSKGMDFALGENLIYLPQEVEFNMIRVGPKNQTNQGVSDNTKIVSDRARIDRNKRISYFTMNPTRPLKKRFVHVTQPELFVRSRRVNLNYGELPDVLQYMEAHEDVFIEEIGEVKSFRYGTCGRADFDTKENIIILTQYPQVYQDKDTVTGEVITIHRDTDIVEVKHSNAFSRGQ